MDNDYRVLSMWEPWATLHAMGIKKIETRPKPTTWAGDQKKRYYIQAALKWSHMQVDFIASDFMRQVMERHNLKPQIFKQNLGCIIGSVNYISIIQIPKGYTIYKDDTREDQFLPPDLDEIEYWLGDYTVGRYAWIGANHTLTLPIPYKGSQGYYAKFKGNIRELTDLYYG